MPFTLSHAAAALPLRRFCPRDLHLGALMMGSFGPDLPYFIGALPFAAFCHYQPLGLIGAWLAALLGWLLLRALRAPMQACLPQPYRQLAAGQTMPWLDGRVALSLLLGVLSHIVWDHFTHRDGLGVAILPLLQQKVFGGLLPLYRLLQHLSSIFGLLALGWLLRSRLRALGLPWRPAFVPQQLRGLLLCGLLSLLLASAVWRYWPGGLELRLFHAITKGMAFYFVLLCLLGCVLRLQGVVPHKESPSSKDS